MNATCPHCAAGLLGDPIPQKYIDEGWYGTKTHYDRTIGVEVRGVYDGVLYWACPDCGGTWHRWPEDHHLRARAEKHMPSEIVL